MSEALPDGAAEQAGATGEQEPVRAPLLGKERGILFSAPMVVALLAGRKTQTRRLVKGPRDAYPAHHWDLTWDPRIPGQRRILYWPGDEAEYAPLRCPYGVAGDRLWVKETFHSEKQEQAGTGAVRWVVIESGGFAERCGAYYRATYDPVAARAKKWRSGRFMPRCLSRITLEISEVRVQRLQDIGESDAKAEGVTPFPLDPEGDCWTDGTHRTAFNHAWGELHGWTHADRASWLSNPWVWAISFQRVQ